MKTLLSISLFVAMCASAFGQPRNPIYAMLLDGNQAQADVMLGVLNQQAGRSYIEKMQDLRAHGEKLDADVSAAVKFAHGKPEVVKAVKEYYASASAFISNGIPTNGLEKAASDRLQSDMESKEKSLKLEMNLAGMK